MTKRDIWKYILVFVIFVLACYAIIMAGWCLKLAFGKVMFYF